MTSRTLNLRVAGRLFVHGPRNIIALIFDVLVLCGISRCRDIHLQESLRCSRGTLHVQELHSLEQLPGPKHDLPCGWPLGGNHALRICEANRSAIHAVLTVCLMQVLKWLKCL